MAGKLKVNFVALDNPDMSAEPLTRKRALEILHGNWEINMFHDPEYGTVKEWWQSVWFAIKTLEEIEKICENCGCYEKKQGCTNCRWNESKFEFKD